MDVRPETWQEPSTAALGKVAIGVPELDALCDEGLITQVYAQLTSGKEGTVYCCRAHPSTRRKFLAAKIYRQHAATNHKWEATYFEGRERVLKKRTVRAIQSRSAFGKVAAAGLWVEAEYGNLQRLAETRARTPMPVACCGRAILMEYIGNGTGPAPQLHGIALDRDSAARLFDQILHALETMLRQHLVHGDLSPYNILVWEGEARIIDLPQAVDARFNRAARSLLLRDLQNLAAFFRRCGLDIDPLTLAADLWERYLRAQL